MAAKRGAAVPEGGRGRRRGASAKNIAKLRAIVICPVLTQLQSASLGRRSTRIPRSPSFSSSERCLKDKRISAIDVQGAGSREGT